MVTARHTLEQLFSHRTAWARAPQREIGKLFASIDIAERIGADLDAITWIQGD